MNGKLALCLADFTGVKRSLHSEMQGSRFFIRNLDALSYLEIFLVSAVAAILGIRLFLELTSYPQLGGPQLHIAHMLWGGLFMLASILILFSFLSRASKRLATVLGGVGFGTFIDEIGKFVTRDHNYFYEPAVSLIYLSFIVIFLVAHIIRTRWEYSEREYLMNALQEMEELALQNLDSDEQAKALWYLERSDPDHPLVPALKNLVSAASPLPTRRPGPFARFKRWLREKYERVGRLPGFTTAVALFFVIQLVISIVYAFLLVFFLGLGWEAILRIDPLARITARMQHLTFVDGAQLVSSLVSAVFILFGVVYLRRSRLAAFEMFERSILVAIFMTNVFNFYTEQFYALVGLGIDILLLLAVRFVIEQEQVKQVYKRTSPPSA
jgi:hypothetical protein